LLPPLSQEVRYVRQYRNTAPRYKSHSFGGTYLELTPNELIRYNDQFDDPNLTGHMFGR
jgi:uncharacterized protein YndB with AHSA1/START domain